MIDKSAPIAVGRTAEIFAWGDGQVLKLIRPGFYPGLADQEWTYGLTAWQLGAPVPKPIELVEVDGRRGVVLERVQGTTLSRCILASPWRLVTYARMLARQHAALHAITVPQFPSLIERARNNISKSSMLVPKLKDRLLARLAMLPDGDRICHGDFHPENVLITDRGPVVIDWEGCTRGDPSADVAVTRMFLHIAMILGKGVRGWLMRPYLRTLERIYLAEYNHAAATPARDQGAWMAIVIAMRLDDGVGPLLPRLISLIELGLAV